MWEICGLCNKHKALWNFNKYTNNQFGIQKYCRCCQKIHNEKYRKNNILQRAQYKKQYNIEHKDKNNEYNRQYHVKHRVEINERHRLYRRYNMDKDSAKSAKRRAIKLNQTPELDESEIYRIELLYHWASVLGRNFQVDHIVSLSKGGSHHPDNMHIISRIQNLRKKDRDPKEFYGKHYYFITAKLKGEGK